MVEVSGELRNFVSSVKSETMNEALLSQLYFKDTAFSKLMQRRIYSVLLVASTYDAFMLEEDGRLEEQIYLEYVSLNLSSPPRIVRVSNYDEALALLKDTSFDLLISMPAGDLSLTFTQARLIKERYPAMPFVVLTPFSREVSRRLANEDLSHVDYVFSWLGNVDLIVAIIKLLEDKMNAPDDVNGVGVQMIMLVEDSVRFYSSILPTLYKFLLRQSQRFATEALNAHEAMLRMRGRPKVMLARDYEEALQLYDIYHKGMLGVISDVSFKRGGVKQRLAGIDLAHELRCRDPYLPIIIESSDADNRMRVAKFDGTFIDKNSKKLPVDLGNAIMSKFGFGDFIIREPGSGREIMRIHNLKELQNRVFDIPAESLLYHAHRNDISRWLYSRALFPLAQVVEMHRFVDIDEAPAVRQLFFDLIVKYRRMKNRGVVAEFKRERFDKYSNFARIGQGSLGGKGRGLAFIDAMIKNHPECDDFDGMSIQIPHTVVLCTDVFDAFMEDNGLYPLALSDAPDEDILKAFLKAQLPDLFYDDFAAIYDVIDEPFAVRSSSLLEDSHYQPFAGVYATYMVPHLPDRDRTIRMLAAAVKAVYASVFMAESKAYMTATSNVIDQEKMAVVIQGVAGTMHGDGLFYPSFSGVGRSLNYYPVGEEAAGDGVCELAVGLGKYIVDGGLSLRFSPRHPRHVLQTSTTQLALRDTQQQFYALDTAHDRGEFTLDEAFNIVTVPVQQAAEQGDLRYIASTYDFQNDRIVDNDSQPGRKVITFANVLQHGVSPVAPAIEFMLNTGAEQMQRPVEIEFAGVLPTPEELAQGHRGRLYWLQIRPMIDRKEMVDHEVLDATGPQVLLRTTRALGHGVYTDIHDIVVMRPDQFGMQNNIEAAAQVEHVNRTMAERGAQYMLIGVGRWGSSDPALGVPVKWAAISQAAIIVETSIPGKRIEPSQGTHFFQNLTSFGVGYLTVGSTADDGFIDTDYLDSLPDVYHTPLLRVIHIDKPLKVAINGQQGNAVVLKPEQGSNP